MTALLEALRRIETQRPVRSSASAPAQETPAAPEVSTPAVAPQSIAEPATIRLPDRKDSSAASNGEASLSSRATVAADVEAAAMSLVHRFRAPALVALVTCGDREMDSEIVAAVAVAIEDQGFAVELIIENNDEDDSTSNERCAARGYRLLHTTTAAALEHTRLLGRADGVVMLVELHRTPIYEAEAAVGSLRREAVAVSGILVIN